MCRKVYAQRQRQTLFKGIRGRNFFVAESRRPDARALVPG